MPTRPGIGADRPAADPGIPVHIPDRDLAAGVLKKDVGTPAACPDGMPTRPGNGADSPAADPGVPMHFPDRDLAAGVLQKDVGAASACSNRVPDSALDCRDGEWPFHVAVCCAQHSAIRNVRFTSTPDEYGHRVCANSSHRAATRRTVKSTLSGPSTDSSGSPLSAGMLRVRAR